MYVQSSQDTASRGEALLLFLEPRRQASCSTVWSCSCHCVSQHFLRGGGLLLGVGVGEGDIVGQDGSDKGSEDKVPVGLGVMARDR